MTTFRYPLPEAEPTSPWGGFSDEARTALTRIAMGPSPANQLLTPDGNGAEGLSGEVQSWASAELEDSLSAWGEYIGTLEIYNMPHTYTDVARDNPNFAQTVSRLYEAKQALVSINEVTPENLNLGETMHLALVPWQLMRDHLGDFDQWVKTLRTAQGVAQNDDYINDALLRAIKSDQPLYRDAGQPTQMLTPSQYLDKKIAEDGPWGVMLMQTSKEAGIDRIKGQSPDQMTDNGTKHLELAGSNIDVMGVFEWLALTFQKDPKELSPTDAGWLLANRMTVDGDPRVPDGYWGVDQVRSGLNWADYQNDDMRVRLAVM